MTLASVTNFTVWFAIIFFVFLETGSVFATGVISGIYLTLTALSGIWFGSLVDHHKKKHVLLASSFVSLFFYAVCFWLYATAPTNAFKDPANAFFWVFVILILLGVIAGNVRSITIPILVTILIPEEKRDKANGLSGTAFGISFLITSVISGLLVGSSGMYGVLILGLIVTCIVIAHMLWIRIPELHVAHTSDAPKTVDIRGTLAAVGAIPGLIALIFFTTFNNFLGGVFMALMDAYGLSLVSVEMWGFLWGILSTGFIVGGLFIARFGLGKNPLRALFMANIVIWSICCVFTVYPSIFLLAAGMFIYLCVVPYIEASEHTIIQKVVPVERQGRVFGFAQSVEQSASPLTAFLIAPIAQFIFIPFMTTGAGVELIGDWFGTGSDRGIALVFTLTGIIGLIATLTAMHSKYYRMLSNHYLAR